MASTTDKPSVVVTGSSGYIGGQTVLEFFDAGYNVVGIDIKKPRQSILDAMSKSVIADFSTDRATDEITKANPLGIVHCAGSSLVAPSMNDPESYYTNNFTKTKRLLDNLLETLSCPKIIFSSSAAVYGNPTELPTVENSPCIPISPYGESKLMVDMLLSSYHKAYGINYVSFRYFNASGADPQGRHGQDSDATHIISRVVGSLKNDELFVLNGKNYDTPDGTCIRDYIHVCDIARAHRLAVENPTQPQPYNLGSSTRLSNLDIINKAQSIIGKNLDWKYGENRGGDPDILTADTNAFYQETGWQPLWNIDDIITHAWNWRVQIDNNVA
jgi:UDP-glucose 4-epimerase